MRLHKINYNVLLQNQAVLHDQLEKSHAKYCKVLRNFEDSRDSGLRKLSEMWSPKE